MLRGITISKTFGSGTAVDNWDVHCFKAQAATQECNKEVAHYGYKRFTGTDQSLKGIANPLLQLSNLDYRDAASLPPRMGEAEVSDPGSLAKAIVELEKQMKAAAKRLEFEEAATIRDRIKELRAQQIYKA